MKFEVRAPAVLLEALRLEVPGASNRTLRQMLEHGRVAVNGEVRRAASHPLAAGDVVEVGARRAPPPSVSGLEIVYEDPHLLVVHKPAGLLTVATPHEHQDTLFAHLKEYVRQSDRKNRVFVVHRLDKFVSGLLVLGRTERTRERLRALFRRHDVRRNYWAVVEGVFEPDETTIRSRLAEDAGGRMRSTESGKGKDAVTHVRVLRRYSNLTALEITLETGRKNQIRAHLSEAGHPIAGDRAYGSRGNPLKRMGLHAFRLGFVHPETGVPLLFETDPPPEFVRYLPAKPPIRRDSEGSPPKRDRRTRRTR